MKTSNVPIWVSFMIEFQSVWGVRSPLQKSQNPSERPEGFLPRRLRGAATAAWADPGWALEPHIGGESGEAVSRRSHHPSIWNVWCVIFGRWLSRLGFRMSLNATVNKWGRTMPDYWYSFLSIVEKSKQKKKTRQSWFNLIHHIPCTL